MTAPPNAAASVAQRQVSLGVVVLPDTSHETIQRYVMDRLEAKYRAVLFSEGAWWRFDKIGAWMPMAEELIWAEVQAINGVETLEGAVGTKPGKSVRVNSGMCESVCALARARFRVDNAFDTPAEGFVTPCGLWTITPSEGWSCRPAVPDDRVRLYVDDDPIMNVTPTAWVSVLCRMWGHENDFTERCAWLHEWGGAMLCGTVTRYQMAPILVGDGENGKSVLLDIVAGLVPAELRCSVTPDELENNRFASSRLVGKALNCVAEIPGGELMTSARIKAIIDGSEQSAERKGKDGFEFRPRAGHIFSANTLPHVRDLSHGFWRRWAPLTCTAPKLATSEKRRGLAQEILLAERGQILGYLMTYYEQMVMERRGYSEVPSIEAARLAWRGDSDNVQQWVDDECTRDDSNPTGTPISDLYAAYKRYALETGTKCVAQRTFGLRLQALGYPAGRDAGARTRPLYLTLAVTARRVAEERHGFGYHQ